MYFLTKYIKSILWGVVVRLPYIEDAWCLKVKSFEKVPSVRNRSFSVELHLVLWAR